mgnify:CR=1 FL=1
MLSPLRSLRGTGAPARLKRFSCLLTIKLKLASIIPFQNRWFNFVFLYFFWQDVLHSLPCFSPLRLRLPAQSFLRSSTCAIFFRVRMFAHYLTWQACIICPGWSCTNLLDALIAWVQIKSNLLVPTWKNIVQSRWHCHHCDKCSLYASVQPDLSENMTHIV